MTLGAMRVVLAVASLCLPSLTSTPVLGTELQGWAMTGAAGVSSQGTTALNSLFGEVPRGYTAQAASNVWLGFFAPEGAGSVDAPPVENETAAFATFVVPSPMRGTAAMRLISNRSRRLRLSIHDVRGREVRRLADNTLFEAGTHVIAWDGRTTSGLRVASGVYILRLEGGDLRLTKRIVLLR